MPSLGVTAPNSASARGKVVSIDLSVVDEATSTKNIDLTRTESHNAKATKTRSPQSASAAASRGSARVRTPSVLLSSHPGDRGQTFPKGVASKNRQVVFCLRMVKEILRRKDAFGFSKPIDQLWPIDQLPGYFDIITKPMDLDTVRRKLEAGQYMTTRGRREVEEVIFDVKAFETDMRLIFENARTYNSVGDFYHESATRLLEKFESRMTHLPSLEQVTPPAMKKAKKRKKAGTAPVESERRADSSKKTKAGTSSAVAGDSTSRGGSGKKKLASQSAGKPKSVAGSAAKKKVVKPVEGRKEGKKNVTVEDLETRLRALRRQRVVNEAGSPASPASGGASYLKEARALYHVPMTYDDKVRLSQNVSKLPSDKLSKIVTLATKHANSSMEVNNNEEIELDIDSLDNEILRDMEAYVNQALRKKKKNGSENEPNSDIVRMSNEEVLSEIETVTASLRKLSKGKSPVLHEENQEGKDKSFYESDSSSDSDDSDGSGSSGYESSSEDSDSSGGEDADMLRRRRERNLAHQQAMQAAGTPLPSPSYQSSGR